jgi:hypothetical protein
MSPVRAGPIFIVLILLAFTRPALAANPRAEVVALETLSKAEGDFLAMNYASGAARLDKALRACGSCSLSTQAALLRDIGTMEFRAGDKGFATKAFSEALKLQPNIDLNPSYDSPDLRAAWAEVKGAGAPPAAAPAPPPPVAAPPTPATPKVEPPPVFVQPKGDFTHTPAAEQRIDTPLPIYIEGGPNGVAHVIIRYKNSEQGDEAEWNHTDMSRVGAGWGGQLPCNAVVGGTMRYYIQAYNKDMDPVATNGDAKNPYQVPIREELAGPPPHLPNRSAPRACHQPEKPKPEPEKEPPKEDCAPGTPGCAKAEKPDEEEEAKSDEDEGDETKGGAKKKKPPRDFPRIWVGLGVHIDFMQIPSGQDLCRLNPSGPNVAQPANDRHFYCTDASGTDFPARTLAGQTVNDQLSPGTAGASGGGIDLGNVRIMASVDYAATGNLLVGVRGGVTLLTYPGKSAVTDKFATGSILYGEARVTGLIGKEPLRRSGIAPILFVGGGYSAFDAHATGVATRCKTMTASCNPTMVAAPLDVPVNLWITNGPGFVDVGGGVRYAPMPKLAFIGALRINLSFGNNGLIPTAGPEVDAQYGF